MQLVTFEIIRAIQGEINLNEQFLHFHVFKDITENMIQEIPNHDSKYHTMVTYVYSLISALSNQEQNP